MKDLRTTSAFDRFYNPTGTAYHGTSARNSGIYDTRCRVVPWPEGAPGPATVPNAGTALQYNRLLSAQIISGIPFQKPNGSSSWYLATICGDGTTRKMLLSDVQRQLNPKPEPPKTYTIDAIRAALAYSGFTGLVLQRLEESEVS